MQAQTWEPGEAVALLDLIESGRPAWQKRAACRGVGPDVFFVERGESPDDAMELCASCVVRPECLTFAIASPVNADLGFWGGMSERARQRERRRRQRLVDAS